ncbi:hypothetical protein [Shimia sp. FJ5]|uniref:hypothetical protein n=1 Tax=Shimia sp. FJ5 TaxID=3079054 RepID=UPI002636F838|nr:hypothetical protein [Shimia sp. FJ5]MDV4143523.1 hypothetical protein [Shimia sp. FJ5]
MNYIAAALCALCFATQSHAGQAWKCTMEKKSPMDLGAVQDTIFFEHDVKADAVLVLDALIHSFGKKYVKAAITSNTEERLRFDWRLKDIPTFALNTTERELVEWRFKAIFIKKNNNLVVRSISAGETNVSRRGVCEKY